MTTILRSEPVDGNQNYTGVVDLTGQVPNLTVQNTVIQSLTAEAVYAAFNLVNPSPSNVDKLYSVTGHTPSNWLGMQTGSVVFLNADPGKPQANTVAGGILTLPPNATIVGAYAIDSTLTGPNIVDIGVTQVTGSDPVISTDVIMHTFDSYLRTGTQVTSQTQMVASAMGLGGVVPVTGTLVTPKDVTSGVYISPTAGPVLTTSGLRITIYYYAYTPEQSTS